MASLWIVFCNFPWLSYTFSIDSKTLPSASFRISLVRLSPLWISLITLPFSSRTYSILSVSVFTWASFATTGLSVVGVSFAWDSSLRSEWLSGLTLDSSTGALISRAEFVCFSLKNFAVSCWILRPITSSSWDNSILLVVLGIALAFSKFLTRAIPSASETWPLTFILIIPGRL